jgi:hypothetical protein
MLLIDHILHKNHIFNNVRFWEDSHFVDILRILLFFLFFLPLRSFFYNTRAPWIVHDAHETLEIHAAKTNY